MCVCVCVNVQAIALHACTLFSALLTFSFPRATMLRRTVHHHWDRVYILTYTFTDSTPTCRICLFQKEGEERVLFMAVVDENLSWLIDYNIEHYAISSKIHRHDSDFWESNRMHCESARSDMSFPRVLWPLQA